MAWNSPKTWAFGEVLTSSDMNTYVRDNTIDLDTRVNNVAVSVATASTDNVAIVFDTDRIITRSAAGTVTFSGSSYTAGKSATVRIVAGAAQRTLNFPAGWKFISAKPTAIAASKTGVLAVTSFGTAEADCVAAWSVEL